LFIVCHFLIIKLSTTIHYYTLSIFVLVLLVTKVHTHKKQMYNDVSRWKRMAKFGRKGGGG